MDHFVNAFLERLVPYSLRDRMRNEFDRQEQVSMSIAEYEAASIPCPDIPMLVFLVESEKIQTFVKLWISLLNWIHHRWSYLGNLLEYCRLG